ncbi:MAG: DUF3618 domain-containing protein [Betaproteobacteria bacterium]
MNTNGDRSPAEIQAHIESTRSDLDQTLSAIEQRLTPGQLVDQGVAYLRTSAAREYVSNLGASARRDPIPLALVGIGLGWLMIAGRRGPEHGEGMAQRSGGPSAAAVADGLSGTVDSVRDSVSSVRDSVSQATDRIADATRRIGDTARAARDRAGQLTAAAHERSRQVRSGYARMVDEQPLALGAIGLAVGAVLAASAPRTHREDDLMGDASDRMKDDLKRVGEEQIERARSSLDATLDSPEHAPDTRHETVAAASDGSAGSRPSAPGSP